MRSSGLAPFTQALSSPAKQEASVIQASGNARNKLEGTMSRLPSAPSTAPSAPEANSPANPYLQLSDLYIAPSPGSSAPIEKAHRSHSPLMSHPIKGQMQSGSRPATLRSSLAELDSGSQQDGQSQGASVSWQAGVAVRPVQASAPDRKTAHDPTVETTQEAPTANGRFSHASGETMGNSASWQEGSDGQGMSGHQPPVAQVSQHATQQTQQRDAPQASSGVRSSADAGRPPQGRYSGNPSLPRPVTKGKSWEEVLVESLRASAGSDRSAGSSPRAGHPEDRNGISEAPSGDPARKTAAPELPAGTRYVQFLVALQEHSC